MDLLPEKQAILQPDLRLLPFSPPGLSSQLDVSCATLLLGRPFPGTGQAAAVPLPAISVSPAHSVRHLVLSGGSPLTSRLELSAERNGGLCRLLNNNLIRRGGAERLHSLGTYWGRKAELEWKLDFRSVTRLPPVSGFRQNGEETTGHSFPLIGHVLFTAYRVCGADISIAPYAAKPEKRSKKCLFPSAIHEVSSHLQHLT